MGFRANRRLFQDAKGRAKEAQKLLRRARRRLEDDTREAIQQAISALLGERKARNVEGVTKAIEVLDRLVEEHLATYRKNAFREYSESIGLAVLFALMLRAFVVEAFQIPSESMVPTLLVGDHLFVNKFVYGVRIPFTRYDLVDFGDPERGDVVVFIYPVEEVRTQVEIRDRMAAIERYAREHPELGYPPSLDAANIVTGSDDW